VSARYGDKQPAPALQSALSARDADFDTVLVPWHGTEPSVTAEDVAVDADSLTAGAAPRALRITLEADGVRVVDHWFHARGLTARRWRIGGFEFSGRWAHWREGADGRVLRAVSHDGAALAVDPAALEPA